MKMSCKPDKTYNNSLKIVVHNCLNIIRMYDWLMDFYVVDYYVDNHWQQLPQSWQRSLQNIDPQDLGKIIFNQPSQHLLPLSLLALLKSVQYLTINRNPKDEATDTLLNQEIDKSKKFNKTEDQSKKKPCNHVEMKSDLINNFKNHPKLKNLFLKHVKLKKRHEISKMADVVAVVASRSMCEAVIDFGSGLGHLVRILSYKHGLNAAGIECQPQLTEDARKLDRELEYTAKKYITKEALSSSSTPCHINLTLSSPEQLERIQTPFKTNYGLLGLHPCGDLGPLLIKHFVQSDNVKFICVVGCCYMKLTCKEDGGYPLSKYLKDLKWNLSYQSREIACHAIEVYCERLCLGKYEDLKIHAFRGVLEKLLVEIDPNLKHSPVRSIKHTDAMSFQQYCVLATERIGRQIAWSDAVGSRVESMLAEWKRVVIVYTLRLALAPLIETVILLDRMLFIMEHGMSCEIHPVFDPKISPRNHIIIGRRL